MIRADWRDKYEPEIAARQHGEHGTRLHIQLKAEVPDIERLCFVDVIDDVTDADGAHRVLLS
jgi:hypothetical protein